MKQQPKVKRKPAASPAKPAAPLTPRPALLDLLPERFDFWTLFAVALAVRLVYVLFAWSKDPAFDVVLRGFDQFTYQTQAQDILKGDLLLRHTIGLDGGLFYYSPIYSYFCAAVFKIIGHQSFWALHLLQTLSGSLTCAVCFSLARTWLGRPAALLAGAMFALLSPWLFYEQELLHEGFMLLFYATTLWGLRTAQLGRRGTPGRLALAGAAGMLAMIGRGNAAAVLAAAVPWTALAVPAGRLAARVGRWRLNFGAVAAFLAGVALVMAPLLLRNHAASGRWSLGMGNGRVLFYVGNNIEANGEFGYTPRFSEAFDKRAKEPGVFQRYFLEDLKKDPLAIAKLMVRKAYLFFNARDLPDNLNYHIGRLLIGPVAWTPVQWELVVPLGLVGLGISLRRRREWSLLWLFSAVFAASLILIIPIGRYRQPILIPLVIFAAFAVEWTAGCWREGHRPALAGAAGALILLIAALWPWTAMGELIRENDYAAIVKMALARKDLPAAERALAQGQRDFKGSKLLYEMTFLVDLQRGDRDQARQLGEVLLKNPPISPETALGVAELDLQEGRLERARMILTSLGQAKIDLDDDFKKRLAGVSARAAAAGASQR